MPEKGISNKVEVVELVALVSWEVRPSVGDFLYWGWGNVALVVGGGYHVNSTEIEEVVCPFKHFDPILVGFYASLMASMFRWFLTKKYLYDL